MLLLPFRGMRGARSALVIEPRIDELSSYSTALKLQFLRRSQFIFGIIIPQDCCPCLQGRLHGCDTPLTISVSQLRREHSSKMETRLGRKGGQMVDLEMFKPVLRAYALGYASSTIPRLMGLLRTLRRKNKTTQEKLDLVCEIPSLVNSSCN